MRRASLSVSALAVIPAKAGTSHHSRPTRTNAPSTVAPASRDPHFCGDDRRAMVGPHREAVDEDISVAGLLAGKGDRTVMGVAAASG